MSRSPLAAAVAALLVLPAAAQASSPFRWGAAAGDITAKSAILWSKAAAPGKYTVRWGTTKKLKNGRASARATRAHDNTLRATATRLKPNTTYFFRWSRGRSSSDTGTFRTAPAAGADATIRFA